MVTSPVWVWGMRAQKSCHSSSTEASMSTKEWCSCTGSPYPSTRRTGQGWGAGAALCRTGGAGARAPAQARGKGVP